MKKYIIITFTVLFVSCSFNKRPEDVISQEDMVNIIVDIHLLDGLMSVRDVQKELVSADTSNYYDLIFEKYGYDRAQFDTSLFYYSKNINTYDDIYNEVVNKLLSIQSDIEEENRQNKEEDSKEEE